MGILDNVEYKNGSFVPALGSPHTDQRQSFLEQQDRKREKLRSQAKRKIRKQDRGDYDDGAFLKRHFKDLKSKVLLLKKVQRFLQENMKWRQLGDVRRRAPPSLVT
ncbi:hypothetical protein E2C01_053998 [Portunus trituberculatus]|uniref:Uncharacterized protein n=1 Tax=Portunus trituberculatus TaxID=210409 RepID=A0A5B7GRK2_PORTR|nr:hypothetical protein [Portunus trituberculatus]